MQYDSTGFLEIHTFTAGGALPVPNINVRITGTDEGNLGSGYTVTTDADGISDIISLPTPSKSYSMSPGAAEQPYANYDIEAFGAGYYPKKLVGVAIFEGAKSILPMEMVPNAQIRRDTNPPSDTNYSVIYENEELE